MKRPDQGERAMWFVLAFLLFSWTGRCRAQTPYSAPAQYGPWFHDVLECSGVVHPHATFPDLSFVSVPGEFFMADGHADRIGYAYVDTKTIYVIASRTLDERVIKHEMLHQILGVPGHGPMFALCGAGEMENE
jgi:hypothetical protein